MPNATGIEKVGCLLLLGFLWWHRWLSESYIVFLGSVVPHVCTAMFDCEATFDGAEEGQTQVHSYMVVY